MNSLDGADDAALSRLPVCGCGAPAVAFFAGTDTESAADLFLIGRGDPQPCTVLDPFSGSGTTALVADRLQRHAIGIDLHHTYQEMAVGRFAEDAPLLAEVER